MQLSRRDRKVLLTPRRQMGQRLYNVPSAPPLKSMKGQWFDICDTGIITVAIQLAE